MTTSTRFSRGIWVGLVAGVSVLLVTQVTACTGTTQGSGGGTGGGPATGSGGAPVGAAGATGSGGAATTGAGGAATGGSAGGRADGGTGATGAGGTAATGAGGGGGAAGVSGGSGGGVAPASCTGASYDAASPPATLTLSGSLGAHDPAVFVLGDMLYLYATGLGAKTSTNLTTWQGAPNPLNPRPAWVAQMVPGATNLWAPDVSFFGGMYHLYYAASTFGSNKSCIGHATRAALDSGAWADQGTTICSNMGTTDNWNAIDPNVVIDDAGTPWLEFGSFWGGLKMIQLDATGARVGTMLYSVAARPNAGGALEGGWVFKNCGYYYLFSSWGACCSGAYDYNMRVGRSTSVTGPYVDKAGVSLMQGGGTLLVQGDATWTAPGHNAVITYGGKTYNVYHALTGANRAATLRISELVWDSDGWPVSGGP
jgi:arabinan endo-1,5-alpha-L-arabinosidase